MERYEGIKFKIRHVCDGFSSDQRLEELHEWVYILGELGLAPVHPEGAYGNHSYRYSGDSFIITRTGMSPGKSLSEQDYCRLSFDLKEDIFLVKGKYQPSSESFLHHAIYQHFASTNAIMHGHCNLLSHHAAELNIVETAEEHPYGTRELALSATDTLAEKTPFIILKNHGFVAMGRDIQSTARLVLHHYSRLINLLRQDD